MISIDSSTGMSSQPPASALDGEVLEALDGLALEVLGREILDDVVGVVELTETCCIRRVNRAFATTFASRPDCHGAWLGSVVGAALSEEIGDLLIELEHCGQERAETAFRSAHFGVAHLRIVAMRIDDGFRIVLVPRLEATAQWSVWEDVLRASRQLICVATLDGQFVHLNPQWSDTLGYTLEELKSRPYTEFVHPDDHEATVEKMEALVAGELVEGFRNRYRHRDGSWRWLDWRATTGIIPNHVSAVAVDVTDQVERARLEEERARQELIVEMTGGVAHDFNNLLTVIIGFAETVLDELQDAPTLESDLTQIVSATERASRIANQLVAISQETPLSRVPIELSEALSSVTELGKTLLPADVELVVDRQWSGEIYTDPLAVERILLNLIINARDAMKNGGTIAVTTRLSARASERGESARSEETSAVSKADTDDWIEISVTDTGPGVPREHLDDIFKPYFTTRQDDGGTGLGLTVCRALACQLGGTLTAETVPGIGARFTLLLPTFGGATSDDDEVDRKLAPPSDRPLEVLVVDDEVLIRRVIARTLDARPVEYELAVDAEEALELAATERRFDVLVTDLSMPGMSGTTLIETLFERDQLPPAVFVMTGKRTDLGDMSCVVDVSVFEKPFTPADLLSALDSLDSAG